MNPDPLEVRLAVVVEMLDRAVEEVRRVMEEIKIVEPKADKGGEGGRHG